MVQQKIKDSLGSSSHHRSTHSKNEFMSVTVRKEDPKEKTGIRLGMEDTGRVCVTNIATNGIFHESEVEVGDIVLSINGKRLQPGEGPEDLIDVISKARVKVTVVVKKPNIAPRKVEKPVEPKPKGVEDNNLKSRKSYTGKAHINADGSLKVGGVDKDQEAAEEQMVISAQKEHIEADVGVVFEVQDSKLFVSKIKKTGIFPNTQLAVGDRVVSINDMSFRGYVDAKYALLMTKKAEQSVTIVVEKGHQGFKAPPGTKKLQLESKPKRSSSRVSQSSSGGEEDSSTSSCSSFGNEEDDILSLKNGEPKLTEAVISAPKKFASEEVGVSIREKHGMLFVEKIAADSIFSKSSLSIGDRVMSINDKSFMHRPDSNVAKSTMRKAKEAVSLVVQQKGHEVDVFQETAFDLDGSSNNLVWQ